MKWILGSLAFVTLVVVGYVAVQAVGLGATWMSVDRVSLDIPSTTTVPGGGAGQESLVPGDSSAPSVRPDRSTTTTTTEPTTSASPVQPFRTSFPTTTSSTPPEALTTSTEVSPALQGAEEAPNVMALVGSDSRQGLEDTGDFGDFSGQRADVIVLAIRDGSDLRLVSVPRDLWVEDLCTGGSHRISSAYGGCGDTNGLAHLVHELENVSGLDIENAAAVDLAGFQDVIDAIGGYEICTDHPIRDLKSGLRIDTGCTMADGETTLEWLRSRSTERLVDGVWRSVPHVSDLTRNARQRQFLVDILHRQTERNDPRAILDLVRSVAPHLTIDDQMSLVDAASWLWGYRNAEVDMAEIPVSYRRTDAGASVLVPTVDVAGFIHELAS